MKPVQTQVAKGSPRLKLQVGGRRAHVPDPPTLPLPSAHPRPSTRGATGERVHLGCDTDSKSGKDMLVLILN